MKPRSKRIILTNEAAVLRTLRTEAGLSMRAAGVLIGISTSTVAHIETGRMNPPKGDALENFLRTYGGIKLRSFYERVRTFQAKQTPRAELLELIRRANSGQVTAILHFVRSILA